MMSGRDWRKMLLQAPHRGGVVDAFQRQPDRPRQTLRDCAAGHAVEALRDGHIAGAVRRHQSAPVQADLRTGVLQAGWQGPHRRAA